MAKKIRPKLVRVGVDVPQDLAEEIVRAQTAGIAPTTKRAVVIAALRLGLPSLFTAPAISYPGAHVPRPMA